MLRSRLVYHVLLARSSIHNACITMVHSYIMQPSCHIVSVPQGGHPASSPRSLQSHRTAHCNNVKQQQTNQVAPHSVIRCLRWLGNSVYNLFAYFSPFSSISNLSCIPSTFPSNLTILTAQLRACVSISTDVGVDKIVTGLLQYVMRPQIRNH